MQKRICRIVLLVLTVFTLCGCQKTGGKEIRIVTPLADDVLFKIGEEVCSVPEANIIFAAQKKAVEDIYGEEIWSVASNGITFEENTRSAIKDFLARMNCMKLMASEYDLHLDEDAEKKISACTDAYLEQLSEAEQNLLSVSRDDVKNTFTAYYYYNTLMENLSSDMETEISDNDARIMQVEYIFIPLDESENSLKKAQKVYSKVKNADSFADAAKASYEGGATLVSLARGQLPQEAENAAFSLANGQVSELVEAEDGYYIFHCVNDYDREATIQHKTDMLDELKEKKFTEEYNQFVASVSAQFNENAWEKLSIRTLPRLEQADFFEIYQDNFE